MGDQPMLVPNITEEGFLKTAIPKDLLKAIKDDMDEAAAVPEACPGSAHLNCRSSAPGEMVQMLEAGAEVKEMMEEVLRPMAEEWAGIELVMSRIYGVRRYRRGATLALHLDRLSTHVVSIILNIDQDVDQDWPLMILDHQGDPHKVVMDKGQMVFYESARLPHGRMEPLHGEHYDNIFIHFKPTSRWYSQNWNPEFVP